MIDLKSTISIDFGTTNSSVYIYRNNHSEAVPNSERQGVNQFPSFVEYSGSNIITGYTAWENFGKTWEIHHIKPLHTFDFIKNGKIDHEQIKIANSLDNLQPLTKEDHYKIHHTTTRYLLFK